MGAVALFASAGVYPITITSNWGTSGPGASPQNSPTKILTVPSGNPGNVRLHVGVTPSGTIAYSKNGGGGIPVTIDVVVVFANTDTLAFILTGASDIATILAYDNTTGALIGNSNITTT